MSSAEIAPTARSSWRPSVQIPPWSEVRQNAVSGLVVGVIAIPLSIALAVAVGVPPVAGLYTAIYAGAFAALFGGSKYNITGPTAALVPILSHATLAYGVQALPLIGLISGLLLLVMSHFRLGALVRYMPGLVITGFTAGIALSIAFSQLNNFLAITGTNPHLERFDQKTWDTFRHLGTVGWTTPLVGFASLALVASWPHIPKARRVPGALVAVTVATIVARVFDVSTPTIASRYGDLPRSLPSPSLSFLDAGLAFDVLPIALAVAVLGAVESLLSAVVADGMAGQPVRHDSNKELRGQGIANVVNSMMGGIPATAAIARTAAGIRSGATSRISGVFHALTVLIATLALGGLAGDIPLATLAAILLFVAWNIAEAPEVARLLRKAPRADLAVLVATILITLFSDLTYAIGFGVLASMVLLIRRLVAVPAAQEMLPDDTGRISQVSPELAALIKSRPDISFFTAHGALSFHSAADFEYTLRGQEHRPLILRMKDVYHIDATGLLTLEGIIEHRQSRGERIILTAIQPGVRPVLERFGILARIGPGNEFAHTRDAIASIDQE